MSLHPPIPENLGIIMMTNTCDYSCMVTEFLLGTNLNFRGPKLPRRAEEISMSGKRLHEIL